MQDGPQWDLNGLAIADIFCDETGRPVALNHTQYPVGLLYRKGEFVSPHDRIRYLTEYNSTIVTRLPIIERPK